MTARSTSPCQTCTALSKVEGAVLLAAVPAPGGGRSVAGTDQGEAKPASFRCHGDTGLRDAAGKELCDVLAVFENHVFLFFDRESRRFDAVEKDMHLTWDRWKREAIEKQIKTAAGAKR
jgi:hypothetical protein